MSELILFFTPEAIGHYLAEATAYAVVILGVMCVGIGALIVFRSIWRQFYRHVDWLIIFTLRQFSAYSDVVYFAHHQKEIRAYIKKIKSEGV